MRRILCALFAAAVLLSFAPGALAADEPTEIYTYEDLLKIADDPSGSYLLAADIDMTGLSWKPLDFTGSFDGGGHALLNLEITCAGDGRDTTWDGNFKQYDTTFAGLFGTLKGATVEDLRLLGVKLLVETDEPCFAGGVAGFSDGATVRGCTVTGRLELRAHEKIFGLAGVVGFGNGLIEDAVVDVELITTDTDEKKKDEQFMGGACSCGYMDVKNCDVTIDGYISEHGYVHSGGLVGMYIRYPKGKSASTEISGNSVTGRIRFFEHNNDRRAYCKAIVGETLMSGAKKSGNTESFVSDEVKKYDAELRPETCEAPEYVEEVTPAGCDTYGYTTHACAGCGYTWRDSYTLYSHTFNDWRVTVEPTTESEGVRQSKCDFCDAVTEETLPKLDPPPPPEPEPEPAPAPAPEPAPAPAEPPEREPPIVPLIAIGAAAACILIVVILSRVLRKGKHSAGRRRR